MTTETHEAAKKGALRAILSCAALIAAALAVVSPVLAQSPPAGSVAAAVDQFMLLEQIDSLLGARQPAMALPLLRTAVARDSTNGRARLLLAQVLDRLGNCDEALPIYQRAWNLGFRNGPYTAVAIARCSARARNRTATLAWLDTALTHRLDGRTAIPRDTTFAFLQHDTTFRRLTGQPPETVLDRTEGWRFDIRLFDEEAKRLHASINREAFSPTFNTGIRTLLADVPSLPDDSIVARLTRLVTTLNDGHSNVWSMRSHRVLQMDLYDFSDGLFLIDGGHKLRPWIGSEVLQVADRDIVALRPLLAPYEHRDNEQMLRWTFPLYVGLIDWLRFAGIAVPDSGTWVTLRDGSGAKHRVFVAADTVWHERKLFPPVTAADGAPLYLQHVDRNYWLQTLPAERAVYWQFNQVWSMPGLPVPAFADSLQRTLRATGATSLIVDIRLNNGGNSFLTTALLHVITAFEGADPSHRVFVISGRGTFSAAQNFLARLERQTNAIFVGEPSSSRPNYVGEDGERLILPHSRVMVNISFKRHQESAFDDDRAWIPVSVPTSLSSKDYFANRDPALEAIREIIRRVRR